MPAAPARIPLEKFLAGLPANASDDIRNAAIRMMHNEQIAMTLRGVEAELRPFFITAVVSFVAGMVLLLFFFEPGGFLDRIDGAWPILTASLAFLPGLLAYYAFRIRRRSQADLENLELNKLHFLPHGAIYFPSDSALAEQMVTLVPAQPAATGRRSKYEKLKPGAIW